jgi:SAM-dependent methyltransferase
MQAQKAEKNYYELPKQRVSLLVNSFLKDRFVLSKDFFVGKKVLEIGSTINSHIHRLGNDPILAVGIDPLARFFSPAYPRSAEHIEARGEELPLKSESFNVVLCINTLDHTENPSAVLDQIRNVLAKDGTLLFSVDTYSLPKVIRRFVLGKFDPPHPHHFTDSEIFKLLANARFKVEYSYMGGKEWIAEFKNDFFVRKLKKSALKFFVAKLFLRLRYVWLRCSVMD